MGKGTSRCDILTEMIQVQEKHIEEAIRHLEAGDLILFPTETSYALGCDATNRKAVETLFLVKQRSQEKALPVLVPTITSLHEYIQVNDLVQQLAETYWPGPLNIIAPAQDTSTIVALCSRDGLQSVRLSSHPIAAMLVRRFGRPVVATSANISGEESLYSVQNVPDALKKGVGYILNGGDLPHQPASTTIRVVGEDLEILRQGGIQVL